MKGAAGRDYDRSFHSKPWSAYPFLRSKKRHFLSNPTAVITIIAFKGRRKFTAVFRSGGSPSGGGSQPLPEMAQNLKQTRQLLSARRVRARIGYAPANVSLCVRAAASSAVVPPGRHSYSARMLFSQHRDNHGPLTRANVAFDVKDLLPGAEHGLAVTHGHGQARTEQRRLQVVMAVAVVPGLLVGVIPAGWNKPEGLASSPARTR
jgi:hypothetical protein